MEVHENWIPLSMFVGLTVGVVIHLYFRFKARVESQLTIRAAIDKGQELSPEIIEKLSSPPVPEDRDLRRGLIGILAAVAFTLFALILGEEDAVRPLLGLSMFPLCIGAAYLLMYRFGHRKSV